MLISVCRGISIVMFMACLLMISSVVTAENQLIQVTDLAGRTLAFSKPPQKIILGESRHISVLSIFNPENPVKNMVGMLADLKEIDPGTYQLYEEKFPSINDVAIVGHTSADSFSVENVINLGADLAIFGIDGHGPTSRHTELIIQLEKAGVQVVFIDFRDKPIENTIKSISLLGKILNREDRAEEFLAFYRKQLDKVTQGLLSVGKSPRVFIHSRAGLHDHCCETMVKGLMAGLLDYVHGDNIASGRVPGYAGTFNLEYLLVDQPDIYIATAIGSSEVQDATESEPLPYIHIGAGVGHERAQASFKNMLKANKLQALTAVQQGKAYTIWHSFYNSPLNVVAIQVFAKWLYPENFADLDPEKNMAEMFERFQAIPLRGEYWMALDNNS
jgi:iron complex transport system substrate-binding protein